MQSSFMQTMKTLIRLCDVQADLSLRWTHMSAGMISYITADMF